MSNNFDPENDAFLRYFYEGFMFEFVRDKTVYVTDIPNKRKYKLKLEHFRDFPFTIELVEIE